MIDLDTRARHAAEALRSSVVEADLVLTEAPTVRTAARWRPLTAMTAGAVAALVVLLGVWAIRPTVVADDMATTTSTTMTSSTTVPSTLPATTLPDAPVPPVESGGATVATSIPDSTPPVLIITSPTDGQVFETDRITFAGTTEPGAKVFGGPYEATVDADGGWSIVLILSEGSNRATFRAVDPAGNEATASVTAVYRPPAKTTAPPKEPTKDPAPFLAHATWLECAEIPAYDEYYGTGEPGSLVKVVSDWGSGETTVGADGSWYLKVFFPKAPTGVTFDVKVKDSLGRYTFFTMTATG